MCARLPQTRPGRHIDARSSKEEGFTSHLLLQTKLPQSRTPRALLFVSGTPCGLVDQFFKFINVTSACAKYSLLMVMMALAHARRNPLKYARFERFWLVDCLLPCTHFENDSVRKQRAQKTKTNSETPVPRLRRCWRRATFFAPPFRMSKVKKYPESLMPFSLWTLVLGHRVNALPLVALVELPQKEDLFNNRTLPPFSRRRQSVRLALGCFDRSLTLGFDQTQRT